MVDGKLNMSLQYALAVKRANHILGCVKHSVASWFKEMNVPLYSALMQPHLKYCVQFWALEYKRGIKIFRLCPKEDKDIERTRGHDLRTSAEDMNMLSLLSLERRRLSGDLIAVYNFLMRGNRKGSADLFSLLSTNWIQVNRLKLH